MKAWVHNNLIFLCLKLLVMQTDNLCFMILKFSAFYLQRFHQNML